MSRSFYSPWLVILVVLLAIDIAMVVIYRNWISVLAALIVLGCIVVWITKVPRL